MANDNVVANNGSGGATFRTYSDGTNEWPAAIVAFVGGGSANNWTLTGVDASHGMPTMGQQVIPAAATASQIASTSGTLLFSGPIFGGFITNPPNAGSQGIGTAENAYVDITGNIPGFTDATGGNGTSTLLQAGQTLTLPPLKSGVNVYANAGTPGHKLTVNIW